jgi:hypothetical protein
MPNRSAGATTRMNSTWVSDTVSRGDNWWPNAFLGTVPCARRLWRLLWKFKRPLLRWSSDLVPADALAAVLSPITSSDAEALTPRYGGQLGHSPTFILAANPESPIAATA